MLRTFFTAGHVTPASICQFKFITFFFNKVIHKSRAEIADATVVARHIEAATKQADSPVGRFLRR